jgi:hypothetical protein
MKNDDYLKKFRIGYDQNVLIELFDKLPRVKQDSIKLSGVEIYEKISLDVTLQEIPIIKSLFNLFEFSPANRHNVDLISLTRSLGAYVNTRNNGVIILPVSGTIKIEFYNSEEKIYSGELDGPIACNGKVLHSIIPVTVSPLLLVFKIPLDVEWHDVFRYLDKYSV